MQKVRFGNMLIEAEDLMISNDYFVNNTQIRPKNGKIEIQFFIGSAIFSMQGWEDISMKGNEENDPIVIYSGDEIILFMTFKDRMFQVESFFEIF